MDIGRQTENPFRSPIQSSRSSSQNFMQIQCWTFAVFVLIGCLLSIAYLFIAEIPCVLADLEQRNVNPSEELRFIYSLGPYIFNWLVIVFVGISVLVGAIGLRCWVGRNASNWFAAVVMAVAVSLTCWIGWITFSASGWRLLYPW